jgi:hypothetical protein
MTPRRQEIEAAVAAHNAADREPFLPPEAARLLAIMFADADVCQRSLAYLITATNDRRRRVERLLRLLMQTGFLSKKESLGRLPNIYRLHLPPGRRP